MRRTGVTVRSRLSGFARLESALPSWLAVQRGAGSWSRQTAPAVDGTTFIELGTAENTPRWDYDPQSGRLLLLVEPTRTNECSYSHFLDDNANDVPDNWTTANGVPGIDFNCVSGAPHGGLSLVLEDTAVATRGVLGAPSYSDATSLVYSLWVMRAGSGGAGDTIRAWEALLGRQDISLSAAPHGWTRYQTAPATSSVGGGGVTDWVYLQSQGDPAGAVSLCLPDLEAGDCASSYIRTTGAGSVSRAAELVPIDASVVGANSGYASWLWRPDYASTAALTVNPICGPVWAPNWEIYYDVADDKVKLLVDGAAGAESAALSFARQSLHRISVRYGAAGTELIVDGVRTTDPSAWGTPTLAPYLGSRAASANCRPSAYGDLVLARG